MSRLQRIILDSILNGLLSAGGAIITAVVAMPVGTEISDIGGVTWLVGGLTGLGAAIKGGRSYIMNPNTGKKEV